MWSKETQTHLMNEIVSGLSPALCSLSDDIAAHPELSGKEFETSKKIVELLRARGLEVEYPFAGLETAFRASINPGGSKKAAFLAEYDALPEIGHGCGHCASGAASIMAFLAVEQIRDQLGDVQIDLIGTPDEEYNGGKVLMQKQGVFDDYDFAVMVHMMGESQTNMRFFAIDGMEFVFKGAPAHAAAAPEKGRNALNAVRLLFDSTDMMRQHVIREAVISGIITRGGQAANVVPDEASALFLTRAPRRSQLDDITGWVKDCARAAALATRTELEIRYAGESFDEYRPGPQKVDLLNQCYAAAGLTVENPEELGSGSSDIGNVASACLAFHPCMGIGKDLVAHTREFAEAMTTPTTHAAIRDSAKVMLELTYRLFTDDALLQRLKDEQFAGR